MADRAEALEQLVESVRRSPKYRSVSADLVRRVGAEELGKRRNLKAATKATKDRLHQVAGAYLERRLDYDALSAALRQAASAGDRGELRRICGQAMARHTSSRERLPILAEFYATTLGPLAPVRSILDVACGLNPLALPWMPVAADVEFHACDIYHNMMAFVHEFLGLLGIRGRAEVRDVVAACPQERVDVALVLKTIPCLEQLDRAAGQRLLDGLRARHVVASFPVRSLGGARKGMVANYEAHLRQLVADRGWAVERFEFATELAFVIHKSGG